MYRLRALASSWSIPTSSCPKSRSWWIPECRRSKKEAFLESLGSLIDPQDLRWIFLTHDDGDHTGALMEVIEAAPQARIITQFVGLARLETAYHVPVDRMRITESGRQL
jgi:flavorubredoxin